MVYFLLFFVVINIYDDECHKDENIGVVSPFVQRGILKQKVSLGFDIGDTDVDL